MLPVHGTESDRCHHESKDIFPKSVLKEDMEKASKKIPAHILDSEVDDNLKPDRHFKKKGGDDEMIKSEFARSSSEVIFFFWSCFCYFVLFYLSWHVAAIL